MPKRHGARPRRLGADAPEPPTGGRWSRPGNHQQEVRRGRRPSAWPRAARGAKLRHSVGKRPREAAQRSASRRHTSTTAAPEANAAKRMQPFTHAQTHLTRPSCGVPTRDPSRLDTNAIWRHLSSAPIAPARQGPFYSLRYCAGRKKNMPTPAANQRMPATQTPWEGT
eukprot:GHVT01041755.1.p1 GENE.GHVT01041755.1~~GHVT01041755.1.p1  ORF type:complete len:168 (+),score=28.98 GHVT01041755.1:435-938(+)